MKRGLALITGACLILGFQNCSQSNLQGGNLTEDVAITMPGNISADDSSGGISSMTSKVTFVEIPNMAEDSNVYQKTSAVELTPYRLVISLKSGSINLMDDRNEVMEKRCLSSSALQELKAILGGSSICTQQVPSGDFCAQVYSPGYASLYADDERISLGEKRDSCGTGRRDLCGSLSDVFQNYVANLKQNWANMSCE